MPDNSRKSSSLSHDYRHTRGAPPPYQKPKNSFLKMVGIIGGIFLLLYVGINGIVSGLNSIPPSPEDFPTIAATFTKIAAISKTALPTSTLRSTTPTATIKPTNTFTPEPEFTPTITLQAMANTDCIDPNAERVEAKVVRITDGDTIAVSINGQEFKVRYIGVDSPETGSNYASQATAYNTKLLAGGVVVLIKDTSETDRYNRLLRYVFAGGKFVNYEMVKAGYAQSGSWPPDIACDSTFAASDKVARLNHIGMWALAPTAVAKATIIPFVPIVPTALIKGNCSPSYPDFCIPPPPPDLDCKDIPAKRFRVLAPDPHGFDGDHDGIGCES